MKSPVLLVGSPARYPDIRYATNFSSFSPVIFLRAKDEQYLVVSPLDLGTARRCAKKNRVLSASDLPVSKNSANPTLERIICLLKKKNIRAVAVPPYFPVALANKLTEKGIKLNIAEETLFPEREIKTAEELSCIKIAQRAAGKAMAAAIALIADSKITRNSCLRLGNKLLTSETVRNTINNSVRDLNCVCFETIVACGQQAADPHEKGSGPLKANQPIVLDIFPLHIESGYWGDLTRTVSRGTPAPEIQKMYAAVRAAQKAAISKIKAGVAAETIHNAAVDLFKQCGFVTGRQHGKPAGFIHSTGHGIGLEVHEQPSLGPNKAKLKEGNVVTVEPGLYYPVRAGIRIEDIVLVTQTGGRIIEKAKCQFVV